MKTNINQTAKEMGGGRSARQHLSDGKDSSNAFPFTSGFLLAIALPLMRGLLGADVISRGAAFGLYIKMIVSLSLLFLLLLWVGKWAQGKWPVNTESFFTGYVTLTVPLTCILILATVIGKLSILQYALLAFLVHLSYMGVWWFGRKTIFSHPFFVKISRLIFNLMPICYAAVFWVWLMRHYYQKTLVLAIILSVSVLLFFLIRNVSFPRIRWRVRVSWAIPVAFVLILIGLVYRPDLYFDRHHYSFFLAPVNDVLHGKEPFVNSTSQYGYGVIYILAWAFRIFRLPVFYPGFSFLVSILFIFQYLVLAVLLQKATRNYLVSLTGMAAIIYFNYLAIHWASMLRIPAQSPLRYGLTYLVFLLALGNLDGKKTLWKVLEYVLLGVASLWSIETFAMTFISLNVFHFVADCLFAERVKSGMMIFIRRLIWQAGVILLCWGVALTLSYFTTGQLPSLEYYIQYFMAYTTTEEYSNPIDFHSFWSGAVTAVYLLSVYFVFFDRFAQKNLLSKKMAALIAGISVTGILQYSYYFVYDIDFHFALLCIPLIVVLTLWASVLVDPTVREKIPRSFRQSAYLMLVVTTLSCAALTVHWLNDKLSHSLIYETFSIVARGQDESFENPYRMQPTDASTAALAALVEEYAGEEDQIAIFVQPEDETEVLLLTGKTHILDITNPWLSAISQAYSEYVLDRAREVSGIPRYIFYDESEDVLLDLQQQAFQILIEGADYRQVERSGNFIVLERESETP